MVLQRPFPMSLIHLGYFLLPLGFGVGFSGVEYAILVPKILEVEIESFETRVS